MRIENVCRYKDLVVFLQHGSGFRTKWFLSPGILIGEGLESAIVRINKIVSI